MSNFVLSSNIIEVDSFRYYDESKESVTGYPHERPGWILAEDIFFVLEFLLVWSAPRWLLPTWLTFFLQPWLLQRFFSTFLPWRLVAFKCYIQSLLF